MSRRGALAVLTVVTILVLAGSALLVGILDRPTVTASESRFAGVNVSTTLIETDLRVQNPNPVGVSLGGATVNHTIAMNDIVMGTGTKRGLDVAAGNATVHLTTAIDNERIPTWWATHIKNGERTRLDATVRIHSSLLGRTVRMNETYVTETHILEGFNSSEPRPINASVPLLDDPLLVVERTNATWGNVTRERTPMDLEFVVSNPQSIPLPITRIDYTVTMNDATVGDGTTGRGYTIPAKGTEIIRAETVIANDKLDEWWVAHLKQNQHTTLRVAFTAVLELPGGDTIEIPLDGLGYTTTFETDVLGTKNESSV